MIACETKKIRLRRGVLRGVRFPEKKRNFLSSTLCFFAAWNPISHLRTHNDSRKKKDRKGKRRRDNFRAGKKSFFLKKQTTVSHTQKGQKKLLRQKEKRREDVSPFVFPNSKDMTTPLLLCCSIPPGFRVSQQGKQK